MKNDDFSPSLRDESQDLSKQSKDSPSLAEGDKWGGLKAQKNVSAQFFNNKSTHPLAPSAREGVDLGLSSAMKGGQESGNSARDGESLKLLSAREGEFLDSNFANEGGQVGKPRNDDKNYKNFSIFFATILCVACLISALLGILLYIYDPFMLFHKPYFRTTTYHSDMRLQAKGIIDNVDFDSVILGTSILENTSVKEAGQKLGGKWVNLSLWGSDFNERKIVFEYAIKHKDIKHILFSIDGFVLRNGDRENFDSWRIDLKIYTDGLFWQKYKRYLDKKFIRCARKWSKDKDCVGDKKDLETLTQDEYRSSKKHFGGFANWSEWQKNEAIKQYNEYVKNDFRPKSDETKRLDFEGQKIYLQESILQMIKQNPQVEFSLIFPPHLRVYYALFPFSQAHHKGINGKEIFAETRAILKWLVAEVANLKNAKIYGFDDLDYADNVTNYIDHEHYWFDMNSMQLDAIANGTHILTPQNIDKYLSTMESKIKNYDIAPLIEQIKAWEEKNAKSNDK